MKILLISILFATSTYGATLNCEQNAGWQTQDMYVKANINAQIEVLSQVEVNLKDLEVTYKIVDGPEESEYVWSEGKYPAEDTSNTIGYNPRKYKNHMKFEMSVVGSGSDGYGYLDLIIPTKKLIQLDDSEPFKSYLILTWMDDHFGGTAQVNCQILK